jgi:hypothetical protein
MARRARDGERYPQLRAALATLRGLWLTGLSMLVDSELREAAWILAGGPRSQGCDRPQGRIGPVTISWGLYEPSAARSDAVVSRLPVEAGAGLTVS